MVCELQFKVGIKNEKNEKRPLDPQLSMDRK